MTNQNRQDIMIYKHDIPSSKHSRSVAGTTRIMESSQHPSLHEYLLGLMGNAGCNELVLIRDDPGYAPHDSAPSVVFKNTTRMRFRSRSQELRGERRKKEEEATRTSWSRTTESFSNDGALLVDCDGEGEAIWNADDGACWCECTMSKELTMYKGCEQASVNDLARPFESRKKLAPVPPPPTVPRDASSPNSSMGASPSSVLFHPYIARRSRPSLRRIERATTIPTTRFDLRRDLGYDYHHRDCPQSELKIDGPPCRPQRRPSIRNLDCQG